MIQKNKFSSTIIFLAIFALIIRLLISTLPSFEYDENSFRIWSARLVETGSSQFFSTQIFTNNPLGGFYLFWGVGIIKSIFLPHLSFFSKDYDFFLKLPANFADIISAILIFVLIKKKLGKKWAIAGFLIYTFNPAILFTSAIWGQYDTVAILFLLITTYFALEKKLEPAVISFAVALTLKPQAIFFAPVFLIFLLLNFKIFRLFKSFIIFCLTLVFLYLPFFPSNPIYGLFYVNRGSVAVFNCTTCFVFNFWGIFGNWQSDLQTFINIPFLFWGVILLLLTLLFIFIIKPFRLKFSPPFFYLTAVVSIMTFFMMLTRMHERHVIYFFPFLLLAAILMKSKIIMAFYIFFSLIFLLDLYIPYAYYNNDVKITNLPVDFLLNNFSNFALISFIGFILLLVYYINHVKDNSVS